MSNVAFIGLGMMGLDMARNIIKGGHNVTGYDPSETALKAHADNEGLTAKSAAEAAQDADIIITMLPNGGVVKSALFGEKSVTETARSGSLVIDMSTIHPLETDEIRSQLASFGLSMVEAPVGRTSVHAKTGNALFMVGAEPEDFTRALPYLECMGDKIIDCGGPGTGTRMKIVNNLMSTAINTLTAEVLTLSDAAGLDRDLAIEIMSGTAAQTHMMDTTYPAKVLKGDLTPAFMLDLAKKDLDIALEYSKDLNVPLTLATESEVIYREAQQKGHGAEDWTAVFEMLRKNSRCKGIG